MYVATPYETAKVISQRAAEIRLGVGKKIGVPHKPSDDPIDIAEKELKAGLIDYMIERVYPNGKVVKIPIKEMHICY